LDFSDVVIVLTVPIIFMQDYQHTMKLFIGVVLLTLSVLASATPYTNPIVDANCPDPGVVYHNGLYYAVTTSLDAPNMYPIRSSKV
jgi:hypothetical protein